MSFQTNFILARGTYDSAVDIDLSTEDFEPDYTFFLYVGVEGAVNCVDVANNEITRNFVPGYHPIKLKKILMSGTDATDLGACKVIDV